MIKLIAVTLMLVVMGLSTASPPPQAPAPMREIRLIMGDPARGEMTFYPNRITLRNHERVKLVIVNRGRLEHEIMSNLFYSARDVEIEVEEVGKIKATQIYEIRLKPGKTVELEFTLHVKDHVLVEKGGRFEVVFGCFIPGHFRAGQKGTFVVEGARR